LNKFALILGYNRPSEIQDVIDDIAPQVDYILVIDNASQPPLHTQVQKPTKTPSTFLRDMTQPANLPRLWNIGFEQIRMLADGVHKIAVLTDDVRIPAGWMDTVCEAMDRTGAAAGCTSPWNGHLTQELLKVSPDSDIMNRMFGPAFVLRGETGIRADERLKWWWNDTDLDWKARGAGGMVVVPGRPVLNRYPNASTTGVNAEQAGRDRQAFQEIWGWNPW
jgi:hypothetical protein